MGIIRRNQSTRRKTRDIRDQQHAHEMQEAGKDPKGLPASKRYRVDPSASRTATALCGTVLELGLPGCTKFCDGKYCYSRATCEMQLDIDNPSQRSESTQRALDVSMKAAIEHAREVSKSQPDSDSMSDKEYEDIIRRMME